MASGKYKKGILGGTFNPVHLGHLHLAQVAMQTLELDQLLFIPSYSPPHKSSEELCSFQHRVVMLEMAVAPYPHFHVSDIEAARSGFSYTIDTLRQLSVECGKGEELVFILGFDAFQEMATWKDYRRIPDYATIAVCERDGSEVSEVARKLFGTSSSLIQKIDVPEKKVSSSLVRTSLVKNRKEGQVFLPRSVFLYIEEHQLFL